MGIFKQEIFKMRQDPEEIIIDSTIMPSTVIGVGQDYSINRSKSSGNQIEGPSNGKYPSSGQSAEFIDPLTLYRTHRCFLKYTFTTPDQRPLTARFEILPSISNLNLLIVKADDSSFPISLSSYGKVNIASPVIYSGAPTILTDNYLSFDLNAAAIDKIMTGSITFSIIGSGDLNDVEPTDMYSEYATFVGLLESQRLILTF